MDGLRGYSYALKAAQDAVDIHTGSLTFSDALRAATGLYNSSWTAFQSQKRNAVPVEPCQQISSDTISRVVTSNETTHHATDAELKPKLKPKPNPKPKPKPQLTNLFNGKHEPLYTLHMPVWGSLRESSSPGVPYRSHRYSNTTSTSKNNKNIGEFPTQSSRYLFAYNHNIQSVLMEKDPLLCKVDMYLRETMARASNAISGITIPLEVDSLNRANEWIVDGILTFRKLVASYLFFIQNEYVAEDGRPFTVPFNIPRGKPMATGEFRYRVQTVQFPSRRAWAAFASLYSLWGNTPCAPRFSAAQLYSGSRLN